ncbi:HAD family hydrolase [Enterococcus sp. HY326]|uniref:HAD family hydrolase n=1 Tax=Enterococcus sp. HY326 TaxID=2971265 RepID=UPI00223EC9B4|nr:HAD family hydrolase [Enterococcus sp. HY326]
MITTILFDVDGTLIDTSNVMRKSLQEILKKEKQLEVSLEDLQYILGIPGRQALENFTTNPQEIVALHEKWSKNVLNYLTEITVFPGITEAVKALHNKGVKLGIVTSKTRAGIATEFDQFGLSAYFDCVITATDTTFHKPHPEPILKALDLLNSKSEQTLFVGDSPQDIACAQAAGTKFALAEWGTLNKKLSKEADFSLSSPAELLTIS